RLGVPVINTSDDLDRSKRLAKGQMYMALVSIVMTILALGSWFVSAHILTVADSADLFRFVVLPISIIGVLAVVKKSPVKEAAEMPADDRVAAERDRIVEVWRYRMLPDW